MKITARRVCAGFTLIEIIVVLTIMSVLLVAGIASYSKMNDRAKVEQAAMGLMTQLRAWQKDTDVGAGSSSCQGKQFKGIRVTVKNGTEVAAVALCDTTEKTLTNYTLSNKAMISAEETFTFTFLPLSQGISTARSIVVQNTTGTIQYTITMTPAGGMGVVKTK